MYLIFPFLGFSGYGLEIASIVYKLFKSMMTSIDFNVFTDLELHYSWLQNIFPGNISVGNLILSKGVFFSNVRFSAAYN